MQIGEQEQRGASKMAAWLSFGVQQKYSKFVANFHMQLFPPPPSSPLEISV